MACQRAVQVSPRFVHRSVSCRAIVEHGRCGEPDWGQLYKDSHLNPYASTAHNREITYSNASLRHIDLMIGQSACSPQIRANLVVCRGEQAARGPTRDVDDFLPTRHLRHLYRINRAHGMHWTPFGCSPLK